MTVKPNNARPNPLDDLDERLRASVGAEDFSLAPTLSPDHSGDAIVVLRDPRHDPASVASALAASPSVDSVTHSGQRLCVRFRDSHIAEIGAELELGGEREPLNLLAGRSYVVDFCDPNATKALHAGHLRNIALGNALAGALQAAGGRVLRQTQIADAGRRMGEAMAGYTLYADGGGPAPGEKSDHFVGELYSRYVREVPCAPSRDGADPALEDPALLRELEGHDDLADSLLFRLEAGEDDARELWLRIRDWAMRGQDETLKHLGIHFDNQILESDYTEKIISFLTRALERGVIRRAANGAFVYETGRDEYELLPLTRPDGFPTQNLRALAVWSSLMDAVPDVEVIHVSGDEWRASTVFIGEILGRLVPDARAYPTVDVLHGMVASSERPMSSSEGDATLIDDLLDELAASEALRDPERRGFHNCGAEELAATTLLGFCLDRPANKLLVLNPDRLLDPEVNAGWALAAAWIKAWDPLHDGPPAPAPADGRYRHLVVQSLVPRRLLPVAVERLDVYSLVRFMVHLSRWYLASADSPAVGRMMRSILADGLASLGIAPPLDVSRTSPPPLAAVGAGG
jgi:arginyl-tRNA synthetase